MTLPAKDWLSRKDVLAAVGNWRRLKALEASGALRRQLGVAGLKHARYRRSEVSALAPLTECPPRQKTSP